MSDGPQGKFCLSRQTAMTIGNEEFKPKISFRENQNQSSKFHVLKWEKFVST